MSFRTAESIIFIYKRKKKINIRSHIRNTIKSNIISFTIINIKTILAIKANFLVYLIFIRILVIFFYLKRKLKI